MDGAVKFGRPVILNEPTHEPLLLLRTLNHFTKISKDAIFFDLSASEYYRNVSLHSFHKKIIMKTKNDETLKPRRFLSTIITLTFE
jgi:hypothetical protein